MHPASAQQRTVANPLTHVSDATTSVANAAEMPHTSEIRDVDTNAALVHWPTILVVAWVLGIAANLAMLAMSLVAARRLLIGANPVAKAASFGGASWQLALRAASTPVLVAPNTQIPVALGVLRPRILLPAEAATWPPTHLRIALAHEQAHVERRDVHWQLIARLAAAIYWFHPLTWLALRRMSIERERACDDRVLLAGVSPHDYAAGLVEFATALRGRNVRLLGGLGMVDRSHLADRIRSILNASLLRGAPSWRLRLCLLMATGCLLGVVGFIRPFDPLPRAIAQADQPDDKEQVAEAANEVEPEPLALERVPTSGSILIQVVGPDKQPVEGADIHANVSSDAPFQGKEDYETDENGFTLVALPPTVRILRVWCSKAGYPPMFANWQPEDQPDVRSIPEAFVFPLEQGTEIGGVVTNEDGEPIAGVMIEVDVDRNDHDQRPRLSGSLARGDALVTDSQGRWRLHNVPADNFDLRLKLGHPEYVDDDSSKSLDSKKVTLAELRDQTGTIVMERGVVVTGRVTGPEGNPVERAVVIWGDAFVSRRDAEHEFRTDADGTFRLPLLPPGPEDVAVIARGWMPDVREIEISEGMEPVEFQLRPGKTLRVRVVDANGNPIPGAYVYTERWRGGEWLYNRTNAQSQKKGIPRRADANGVYEWTWAPDDVVEYEFWHEGFAETRTRFAADGREHVLVLHPVLQLRGRVTDAVTGEPINRFTVVPVWEYPTYMRASRRNTSEHSGGEFALEFEHDGDNRYRVRIEADGYRTAMSEAFDVGNAKRAYDFRLQPVPSGGGRVVYSDATPVAGARVFLATKTQRVEHFLHVGAIPDALRDNLTVQTDRRGRFAFPGQFEPYKIIVTHDHGYAERTYAPDQTPGELVLEEWAAIDGSNYYAGRPVSGTRVSLSLMWPQFGSWPDVRQSLTALTDEDGRFAFDRVPPTKWALRSRWSEGRTGSRESLPIDLAPGQRLTVTLGDGALVLGRVVLKGSVRRDNTLEYSSVHLLRRSPGIEPPPEVAALGFDWRRGWNDDWSDTPAGRAYLDTLHHYDVRTNPDGTFLVDGVPEGEYELSLAVYAPPEDRIFVNPIAKRVVRFSLSAADVQTGRFDLGDVEAVASLGETTGEVVSDFAFDALKGEMLRLSDLRGRHVLLHFWCSQWERCTDKLPQLERLYNDYGEDDRLVILSMSLDPDLDTLRSFVDRHSLPWQHGLLGDRSQTDVPATLGVNSVPAYFLIDPDGKLVHKGHSADEIREHLDAALSGAD